jgi:opacity protein-like surface antigen
MMKLQKVVLSAVAACALAATATSASAGGRSLKDAPAYQSWSGFYIGAQAGWGWADVNSDFVNAGGAPLGFSDSVNSATA